MPDTQTWALILHGGAKDIPQAEEAAHRAGLLAAAEAGRAVLAQGGAALDAVEAAVRALENDPSFNAGFGSVLNARGEVEMDAAIMDGETLDVGGIAAVQGVRNPISAARLLLYETPTLLVGPMARDAVGARGAELCDPALMISPARASTGCDTVGCVALDVSGSIAAGTSTGGLTGKAPGRVGDSPIPGGGLYADNQRGGVSLSGDGEKVSRVLLGFEVLQRLETLDPDTACREGLARLQRVGGEAGMIAVDPRGRFGCAHNSSAFAVGVAASWLAAPAAFLHRTEMEEVIAHG